MITNYTISGDQIRDVYLHIKSHKMYFSDVGREIKQFSPITQGLMHKYMNISPFP